MRRTRTPPTATPTHTSTCCRSAQHCSVQYSSATLWSSEYCRYIRPLLLVPSPGPGNIVLFYWAWAGPMSVWVTEGLRTTNVLYSQ